MGRPAAVLIHAKYDSPLGYFSFLAPGATTATRWTLILSSGSDFVQRIYLVTEIMGGMNETNALIQLQAEWAEALDEGHRQEQERLLDLGWHVGPVYTLHLDRKPLVALKYMDTAVVWIKPSSLLRALDRIVDSRDPEEAEEEVP